MSVRSAGAPGTDSCHCPRPTEAETPGRHPSSPAPARGCAARGCAARGVQRPIPAGDALICLLVIAVILAAFAGYTIGSWGVPLWATQPCAIHTITRDCLSAEDMARAYGFDGDWRQYEWEIRKLNQWARWPTLHLGDRVIVPDYREPAGGPDRAENHADGLLDRVAGPPAMESIS